MKVLFTGGGTMGSVTPLIAIAEELKNMDPSNDYYWLGTKQGPERKVVKNYNIEFKAICSGKLRRYFSWLNFLDIVKVIIGLVQSLILLMQWKPQIIVSAGGFTAVPVVWAAWLLGIPSLIHQQDVRVGLANKLCAWPAKQITVCFTDSLKYFKQKKTKLVGNPIREEFKSIDNKSLDELYKKYNLKRNLPIVLIMGGGTGARAINNLVFNSINKLTEFCQIIHLVGKSKVGNKKIEKVENYHQFEFVVNMIEFLQLADVVVSRAGMGSLTELAYLKKPAIIVPIPNSHQEDNAIYFDRHQAIILINQKKLTDDSFAEIIKDILNDKNKIKQLSERIYQVINWQAEMRIADLILKIINKKI